MKQNESSNSFTTVGTSTVQDTAEQITNLQSEILQQAKIIDKYISEGARRGANTETFRQLQDLYKLFKAELNLNFTIRRALMQEKNTSEKVSVVCTQKIAELNDFYAKLSQITGIEVNSLDKATKLVDNAVKNGLFTHKKRLVQENKKLEQLNADLQSQIDEIQAQKALEFAELQAKIEVAEASTKKYKEQLLELQKSKDEDAETIKNLLSQKKSEIDNLNSQFRYQQFTKMNDYYEIKRKYEELTGETSKLREQVQQMKEALDNAIKERDNLVQKANIADSLSSDLQKIENELQAKLEETKRLKKEKKALTKCVNESKTIRQAYIDKIDELQNRLLNIESKAKKGANLDSENRRLQNSLRNATNEIRRLEEENSKLSTDSSLIRGSDSMMRAFRELKNSLNIDNRTSPMEVVRIILSMVNNRHSSPQHSSNFDMMESDSISRYSSISSPSNSSSTGYRSSNGNALQEQIDALQNEVMSLKGEVNKYTQ